MSHYASLCCSFRRNVVTFYDTYVHNLHTFESQVSRKCMNIREETSSPAKHVSHDFNKRPFVLPFTRHTRQQLLLDSFCPASLAQFTDIRCRVCTRFENCLSSGVRGTVRPKRVVAGGCVREDTGRSEKQAELV